MASTLSSREAEKTKRYLLMATTGQDVDGLRWGCDLALVGLGQAFLGSLRQRVDLLRESHRRDSAIYEMSFWAPSQVTYYQEAASDLMQLSPGEEEQLDRGGYVILDRADRPLAIEVQHQQTVSQCRMTLSLTSASPGESLRAIVAWSASPGGSDTSVLTTEVPCDLLGCDPIVALLAAFLNVEVQRPCRAMSLVILIASLNEYASGC